MQAGYQPYAQHRRQKDISLLPMPHDSHGRAYHFPIPIERSISASCSCSPTFSFFRLTSFNPSVLNCICIGPLSWRGFIITSSKETPHTFFYDQVGHAFAAIEWSPQPCVGVRGIVPKQRISHWLKLPASVRHMTMEIQGIVYTWIPSGNSIRLFATHLEVPVLLVIIDQGPGAVNLMITEKAVDANLLEVSIVVAVILVSGRNFT